MMSLKNMVGLLLLIPITATSTGVLDSSLRGSIGVSGFFPQKLLLDVAQQEKQHPMITSGDITVPLALYNAHAYLALLGKGSYLAKAEAGSASFGGMYRFETQTDNVLGLYAVGDYTSMKYLHFAHLNTGVDYAVGNLGLQLSAYVPLTTQPKSYLRAPHAILYQAMKGMDIGLRNSMHLDNKSSLHILTKAGYFTSRYVADSIYFGSFGLEYERPWLTMGLGMDVKSKSVDTSYGFKAYIQLPLGMASSKLLPHKQRMLRRYPDRVDSVVFGKRIFDVPAGTTYSTDGYHHFLTLKSGQNYTSDMHLTSRARVYLDGDVLFGENKMKSGIQASGVGAFDGPTLTIDPGTIIEALPKDQITVKETAPLANATKPDNATNVVAEKEIVSSLTVLRSARIDARGTKTQPIIMRSAADSSLHGAWGGLHIVGNALSNRSDQSVAGAYVFGLSSGSVAQKALVPGYGVTADATTNDHSGTIRYLRIENAGYKIHATLVSTTSFGLYGVGNQTVLDSIHIHNHQGHGLALYGGDVNLKRVLITAKNDATTRNAAGNAAEVGASLFANQGYTGGIQYLIIDRSKVDVPSDASVIQSWNNAASAASVVNSGEDVVTRPVIANATLIAGNSANYEQIDLLNSTQFRLYNSVVSAGTGANGLFSINGTSPAVQGATTATNLKEIQAKGIAITGDLADLDSPFAGYWRINRSSSGSFGNSLNPAVVVSLSPIVSSLQAGYAGFYVNGTNEDGATVVDFSDVSAVSDLTDYSTKYSFDAPQHASRNRVGAISLVSADWTRDWVMKDD